MNVFDVLREKLEQSDKEMITGYYVRAAEYGNKVLGIINQTEQEFASKTNADRIRSMTDEELADAILKIDDIADHIPFCGNNAECNETMDKGELISTEMCRQCLMNWLQREVDA